MVQIRVVEQELVAHAYVLLEGPRAERSVGLVREMWQRGRDLLGTDRPTPDSHLPDGLPADLRSGPESKALAVQESVDGGRQMFLRREHDVLNLALLSAAPRGPRAEPPRWEEHGRLIAQVLQPSKAFLGTAHLYLAKVTEPRHPDAARALFTECPVRHAPGSGWRPLGLTLPAGLVAWEFSDTDPERSARALIVAAPPRSDDALSDWTWSLHNPEEMPVLARYLMHIAKLRYELRTHKTYPSAATLRASLQAGSDEVLQLAGRAGARLADRLAGLRLDMARSGHLVSVLKNLEHTAEIAADNAGSALGSARRGIAPDGSVRSDLDLADWFRRRLKDEIVYLEGAVEGARSVSEVAARTAGRHDGGPPEDAPTIGIITAMPEELAAVRVLLDGESRWNIEDDRAHYFTGTMPSADRERPHHVVVTLLGDTANDAAADGCANLSRSFRSVGYVLVAGIAAGVPDLRRPDKHVRLGDIVVSSWGIVDYDHVVDRPAGAEPRQPFPRPSSLLTRQTAFLEADEMAGRRPWEDILGRVTAVAGFGRPPASTDLLYLSDDDEEPAAHPDLAASGHRPGLPKVHQGYIGSADRALRNAKTRDRLAREHDLRAMEMEGKGVGRASFFNGLEWLVVRGISDYGDERTGRTWRNYASAAAAAYSRALLGQCPPLAPRGGQPRRVRR
ncbi:CATRA conflict system CASPASE/TPR repeat-associated protein [Nonomuraea lactucae]|uniref:CATRA conflict system CASPASE/TPR repeat-associated protein n=1 Tax=Nonomuraea lactucae TaxID=2249762 RepID=UPI000DE45BEC|nr:CATRA conflict system CASPASE/TPR repeat-associated protein [Nonomuraea lactucae]